MGVASPVKGHCTPHNEIILVALFSSPKESVTGVALFYIWSSF